MRIAFKMSVKKGCEAEYEKRHKPVWRKLEETLIAHGVLCYSIFLDEATNDLFAYAEIESWQKWQQIADTEICKKWWDFMAPLMPCHEDNSPISIELKEVFHLQKS
jgi:L-rhamnose mutarotase